MKKVILCIVIFVLVVLPLSGQDEVSCWNSIGPILLNQFPGFGVGSFVQGDPIGGCIQLIGETSGYVMAVFAFGMMWVDYSPYVEALGTVGVCLVIGARYIWGIIRPIWFVAELNAKLQQGKVTFGVVPSIEPCADHQGLNVGMGLTVKCVVE
jgi:hypothetical protein